MSKYTLLLTVVFIIVAVSLVNAQDKPLRFNNDVLEQIEAVIRGTEQPRSRKFFTVTQSKQLKPAHEVWRQWERLKESEKSLQKTVDADTPIAELTRLAEEGHEDALKILRERLRQIPVDKMTSPIMLKKLVKIGHTDAQQILQQLEKEEEERKATEEAKRIAEAKRKADEEAKRKADEEAKQKADKEAKRKADEEAKQKADKEAKQKADEEAAERKAKQERMASYTSIDKFEDKNYGLARVRDARNLYGLINKNYEEVLPCQYRHIGDFKSDGTASVQHESRKSGVIDKTGKVIIPCKYTEIGEYDEYGLARVRVWNIGGECGLVDKTGKEVIPCNKYDTIGEFDDNGLAEVRIRIHPHILYKYGLIDTTGKEVVPCKYSQDALPDAKKLFLESKPQ